MEFEKFSMERKRESKCVRRFRSQCKSKTCIPHLGAFI